MIRPVLLAAAHLVACVLATVIWALTAGLSAGVMTAAGSMPVDPQDEVRVSALVVLLLVLGTLGAIAAVLWWLRGPRRGFAALLACAAVTAGGGVLSWATWTLMGAVRGPAGAPPADEIYHQLPGVSPAAVIVLPTLVAVIVYTAAALFAGRDDLQRRHEVTSTATGVIQDPAQPVVRWSDEQFFGPGQRG